MFLFKAKTMSFVKHVNNIDKPEITLKSVRKDEIIPGNLKCRTQYMLLFDAFTKYDIILDKILSSEEKPKRGPSHPHSRLITQERLSQDNCLPLK